MGKDLKGKELGDCLSQRKDGRYMARFKDRFGKRKCFYGTTLKEVKAMLQQAQYEDQNKLNTTNDSIKLDEWFEKWLTVHKYNNICLSTKANYISVYRKHISPYLGNHKLNDINQLMIRSMINELDKKGLRYETQNRVKILLIDMFDRAVVDNFAKKNPARGIKVVRKECDENEVRVLTNEEQQAFFDTCKGTFYDNLFTVAVSTGLRPGELCALKWEDIDLETNEVIITKTLIYQKLEGDTQKTFHFDPPKTKQSKRRVPLNKTALIALKKQKFQAEIVKDKHRQKFKDEVPEEFKDLLFVTKYGTPINSIIFNDAIKRIIEEINLMRDTLEEFEPFSAHCFRHTFATRCFESGVQPKTVQSYLGHASLKMTMDLYTHVLDTHKKEELLKFDRIMDKLSNVSEEEIDEMLNEKMKQKNEENVIHFLSAI